ncbi:hypothetical protein [Limosilactobacillus reuteri]|uniref:hypothetical protein n=1 Tax=Limosilactobacillus reuteri TaxID=1598 RepID=UPI001E3132DB|nr:hypothetical protein [Limosilactobacillus reuteri]MCC4372337.1 hypothetical protein [Limosilactobacillus reuteri]
MLSRIIWMIVCIIITYFLGKLAWNNLNNHKFIRSIFQGTVAFVALMLALGPIINYEDAHEKTTSAADTASSSSKPSSSNKADDSSDEKESDEVAKARVKNTCDALNSEMSKHSELDGFSMKPSGNQFKVTVPSSATALSDNEQKSLYKSVVDLIYSYDNGTNQGSYVEFDGDDGMPVAHYSYIGDKIKLDE